MERLAKISLANRMLAALLTVVVVVFGVIATMAMRVELFPSMDAPGAGVMVTYPGASPEVMESEVTQPIEDAIDGLDSLEDLTSESSNGFAFVTAFFDLNSDVDEVVDEVRSSVNGVQASLPSDAEVEVMDFSGGDEANMVMALSAASSEDTDTLSSNLNDYVVPEIEALSGVDRVEVFGERQEILRIDPDEDDLEDEGLSTADISQALQDSGLVIPGGTLTEGDRSLSVNVGSAFSSLDDVEDLYMMPQGGAAPEMEAMPPGAPAPAEPEAVRLGDVADVSWGSADEQTISRGNGADALGMMVYKDTEANIVEVSHTVRDAMPDLADELGTGGDLFVTVDTAPFVEDSIDGLIEKGLAGLGIVILLILAFLLSVRTTIVTAVSIPLSLLIAMIALWQSGHTLNMLTLAGLTVAIGRVVDDSIVVLENIKRHLSYGGERIPAILTAVREVAGAITSATLATAAVFLPIAFLGGMISIFFQPFGLTVAIALLASLLVSLTIIPVLAYWFVRSSEVPEEERERLRQKEEEKERRSWLQRSYIPVLRAATKRGESGWKTWRRWAVVGAGVVILVATFAMSGSLRFVLLEDDGQDQVMINQELPAGTSLSATDDQAREVEALLEDFDGVEAYETTVGNDGFSGGTNTAAYYVTLDPDLDVDETREELENEIGDLPSDAGELTVGSLMGMGAAGAEGDPTADVRLLSEDSAALEEAADDVSAVLEDIDGVTEVTSDLTEEEPGIEITPIADEAAEHGLDEQQIAMAAQSAFDGLEAGAVQVGGSERSVVIDTGDAPETLDELREYEIPSAAGMVELGDVADVEEVERPTQIVRSDGERSITVSATVAGDADLQAVSMEVMDEVEDMTLPTGVSTDLGGDADELNEVMTDMGIALLTSIALVFVIMVATFRSVAQPLVLLISVPFAATGALAALLLTDTPMGLPAMIGLLMLVGIVVTNAIVLIDLINQYRREGMSLQDAVIEGGRQRVRPILMTALATVGALVPMALGLGTGSVFIAQSLAMVVIGGLVSSTLLTLLILPAMYMSLEEGKERRAMRRAARRERRAERRATAGGDGASHGGYGEPGSDLGDNRGGDTDGGGSDGGGSGGGDPREDGPEPTGPRADELEPSTSDR
ncbi:efflux RND transporter permease subunit [Spiractinospora alimapuensis]|uniref:efflux RND transporter permease subunit n=1 Tax=Spiractinospora alimapuensis TaxID=2820884 RepID=UPI001F344F2A|nr:efflux RND transporter permease subunit [Spiractinospora alimapuensis]QVQ50714.1 efflux RND transporter permease subunit [Spiractinospora alimapuensis]